MNKEERAEKRREREGRTDGGREEIVRGGRSGTVQN